MKTANEFTDSVCKKLGASFDPRGLPTRYALFAEILKAARAPQKPARELGESDVQSTQ